MFSNAEPTLAAAATAAPASGSEISVSANELTITPATLTANKNATFKAKIRNTGGTKATNFKVQFFLDGKVFYEKKITSLSANTGVTTVTKTYKLPADLTGSHEFSVIADTDDIIKEDDETNNKAAKKIDVAGITYDLSVSEADLKITPTAPMAGKSATLRATVRNSGTGKAEKVKVRFYLNDQLVYEKIQSSIAAKTGQASIVKSLILPANLSGNTKFKVFVDPDNTIAESDEKNNDAQKTFTVGAQIIDLSFDSFKPSVTNPKAGQAIKWIIKVKNNGNAAAKNIKVHLFANNKSSDPTYTYTISNLNVRGSNVKSVNWTVPNNLEPALGYTVRAVIDPDNTINESNEDNNVKTYSLDLKAPDLKMTAGEFYGSGMPSYQGQPLAQWGTASNDNVMDVANVKVALYYYLDNNPDQLIKIAEQNIGTLKKKQSKNFSMIGTPGTIPLGSAIHTVMIIDPDKTVPETDETNNSLSAARFYTEKPRQVTYPYFRVTVFDENGDKLNGAIVKITNTATGVIETKTTGSETFYDSNGCVIFESRPSQANYQIQVTKTGYRTNNTTASFSTNSDSSGDQTVYLDKKSVVSGKVTNAVGQVLPWTRVKIDGTNLETYTDGQGNYGFLLKGGTYTFRYVREGYNRVIASNSYIAPLTSVTLNQTMTPTNNAFITGTLNDDLGLPLAGARVEINGTLNATTDSQGKFNFTTPHGTKKITFKKDGFVTLDVNQELLAGEEYDFIFAMSKPNTDNHVERGTTFVSWHQHEGTPANAFFIPEYNVDVWWGTGHTKMSLDFTKSGNNATLNNLKVNVRGDKWECNRVEGSGDIETSAIDIPITLSAGSCSTNLTQIDVYKVAIYQGDTEIWSNTGYWSSKQDPINSMSKGFSLGGINASWDNDLKVKMWIYVQKKSNLGLEGEGSGALAGYHMDRKLITWYPQKPPTTNISTSWGQIGSYLLGILDNPVNAITGFTDIYTVEEFNQYDIEDLVQFPF
ncbi:MAG: CARDB domain-containing protein [Patescibacteria group bacterium]